MTTMLILCNALLAPTELFLRRFDEDYKNEYILFLFIFFTCLIIIIFDYNVNPIKFNQINRLSLEKLLICHSNFRCNEKENLLLNFFSTSEKIQNR